MKINADTLEVTQLNPPSNPSDDTEWVNHYRHDITYDNHQDTEFVKNYIECKKQIINLIADFVFPEREHPDIYKRYIASWEKQVKHADNTLPTSGADNELSNFANDLMRLTPKEIETRNALHTAVTATLEGLYNTGNNIYNTSQIIDATYKALLKQKIKYDNDLSNWSGNDDEVKHPYTDEHIIEGIVNHTLRRRLEGEFVITPWMEQVIRKSAEVGYLAWEMIPNFGNDDMLARLEQRMYYMSNTVLPTGEKIANSQSLICLVASMYGEDRWSTAAPTIMKGEASGRTGSSFASGVKNAGEGWIGLTGYESKQKCAKYAAATWPSGDYNVFTNSLSTVCSQDDWARISTAFYVFGTRDDLDNLPGVDNTYELMFNKAELESDSEYEICAMIPPLVKGGTHFDSKHPDWLTQYSGEPIKRKYLAANRQYLIWNGNGEGLISSWLTAYCIGRLMTTDETKKISWEDLKAELTQTYNIQEKISQRWQTAAVAGSIQAPNGWSTLSSAEMI